MSDEKKCIFFLPVASLTFRVLSFLELSRTNLLSSVKSVHFIIINTKMSRDVEREKERRSACVRAYEREREKGRMENR